MTYNFNAIIRELKVYLAQENRPQMLIRLATVIAILDAIQRDDHQKLDIIMHSDYAAQLLP